MSGLKILITNHALVSRAGTEMYVYDLALTLQKWGHKPFVYTPLLGKFGNELLKATIPVIDNLEKLSFSPDIIHGHHHLPTLTALLRFPNVPSIYFCHGWIIDEEKPLHFPRILRYIAVSQACYDRLILSGIHESKIQILLNFVDLERFTSRMPLPSKPKRALIFSNQANEQNVVPIIRKACLMSGIQLDVVGTKANNSIEHPESILGYYDLVFAVGKSALEALAVGAAVIVCDYERIGPMVSMNNVHQMRNLNFGLRALTQPLTCEAVCKEIAAYDKEDASLVSKFVRENACKNQSVEQLTMLYNDVIQEYKISGSKIDAYSELNATSSYLQSFSNHLKEEKLQEIERIVNNVKMLNDKLQIHDDKLKVLENLYQFLIRLPLIGRFVKFLKNRLD